MNYYIDIHKLDSVSTFMVLGFILHPRLPEQGSVCEAKALLGFIKRWPYEFKDTCTY